MTTADQLAIVNQTLANDGSELAVCFSDGGLVRDWLKCRRLLVVVHSKVDVPSDALFIYTTQNLPVTNVKDLTMETVIPIDQDFKCEIDSSEAALYIRVTSSTSGNKLLFEMLPGYHTQNFVSEIFRLTDSSVKKNPAVSFAWLDKYNAVIKTSTESKNDLVNKFDAFGLDATSSASGVGFDTASGGSGGGSDSPEASLNRQDIAMGLTPIAARESVVKYEMTMKEEQFTELKHFTIFTGTWNVNGQSPTGTLHDWLATDPDPPDLYAIGFQELDLSKEAFVFNESPKEDEWLRIVVASLHQEAKYKMVKIVRLVGMMLIVFVKEDLYCHISNVYTDTVGTGIMGMLGNKGGVAVRLNFHSTSICFVNSHLAAHVSEFERRNQDFQDINSRLTFTQMMPPLNIKDHDMIYWIGDLNYRITDLEADLVKDHILANNLEDLYKADQLRQQIYRRKVFTGYTEGKLTFPPTYKFDPGTDNWDSSEKARAPAWTDRILWKGDHIEQKVYRSHMKLKVSDHKPVSSVFRSGMKVIDGVKYRRIYEEVMKKLDRLENEFLPQVTVDTTEIIFETVGFLEEMTQTLTVANTGQVPVQFEFIKKLNDKSFCKSWLSVEPSKDFIMPGDKRDLAVSIFVDKRTASSLNSGSDQLYDILVLHLNGGKDIFVTVSGTYRRSAFGSSIEALCRLSVPIAELSAGAILDLEKAGQSDVMDGQSKSEPYPVPKELWFICDLITSLGMHHDQLFLLSGLRSEILAIRDWLDTGLPVDKPLVSIHSAAEALLLFLESLRDPVVPYTAYNQCLECSANYLQCRQVVTQLLPLQHRNVFNYICAFLRVVLRFSAQNNVDPKLLSTLFAPVLLRDPPGTNLGTGIKGRTQQQLVEQKKARFLYQFLAHEPDMD